MKRAIGQRLYWKFWLLATIALLTVGSCSRIETHPMIVTAYCPCAKCNEYTRGRWLFLKLDFWNKYDRAGRRLTAETASGEPLWTYHPGLASLDSFARPWMIPWRVVFPWCWLPHDGTVAADTRYYPFGTRVYVPGYGWGRVADRGRAIKGPNRLDICLPLHRQTERWGVKRVEVKIVKAE
jgi:hypothetical protein